MVKNVFGAIAPPLSPLGYAYSKFLHNVLIVHAQYYANEVCVQDLCKSRRTS